MFQELHNILSHSKYCDVFLVYQLNPFVHSKLNLDESEINLKHIFNLYESVH